MNSNVLESDNRMQGAEAHFFAEPNPDAAALDRLSALYPNNPFATTAYAGAEAASSGEPYLLGSTAGDRLVAGCLAFLRKGRFNSVVEIPSAPDAAADFYDRARAYFARKGVTRLSINTFASPAGARVPAGSGEETRVSRWEYELPLDASDDLLLRRMKTNHRQSVQKAMRVDASFRVGSECSLDEHVAMMNASMSRRAVRGEDVTVVDSAEGLKRFMDTGACQMFQGVVDGAVVSSMMVLRSARRQYLFTSGTSPKGMETGASHFLLWRIMCLARDDGAESFNLGGVSDPESGLARYKERFGAERIELDRAEFYIGSPLRKALDASLQSVAARARSVIRKAGA